jgi:hypothetical protein
MKRLIRKILREQFNYKEKIFKLLQSGQDENIEMVKYLSEGQGYDLKELLIEYFQEYSPPYFKIFNILELTKEEQGFILKKILGNKDIEWEYVGNILMVYDNNGKKIYHEDSRGTWYTTEHLNKESITRDKYGIYERVLYDDKGNVIFVVDGDDDSYSYWEKYEYDDNGNIIYWEDNRGEWEIQKYDDKGNRIYYEGSDGYIEDNR